jgi:hypothetical protein
MLSASLASAWALPAGASARGRGTGVSARGVGIGNVAFTSGCDGGNGVATAAGTPGDGNVSGE